MQRMGLIAQKVDTLRAYEMLTPLWPEEWNAADMDEHHLLLKKLGQTLCRPSHADCDACPVRGDCKTGQAKR